DLSIDGRSCATATSYPAARKARSIRSRIGDASSASRMSSCFIMESMKSSSVVRSDGLFRGACQALQGCLHRFERLLLFFVQSAGHFRQKPVQRIDSRLHLTLDRFTQCLQRGLTALLARARIFSRLLKGAE